MGKSEDSEEVFRGRVSEGEGDHVPELPAALARQLADVPLPESPSEAEGDEPGSAGLLGPENESEPEDAPARAAGPRFTPQVATARAAIPPELAQPDPDTLLQDGGSPSDPRERNLDSLQTALDDLDPKGFEAGNAAGAELLARLKPDVPEDEKER